MERRFEQTEDVGEGGMSSIVAVFDSLLERTTARKLLKDRFTRDEAYRERFADEARLTGQLAHPNIVPIHDFGLDDQGRPYIDMKLVDGETLQELIDAAGPERLSPACLTRFVEILIKVCDALCFAHSQGIVHLDLKPDNIMVGKFGAVYLMDWGIAVRVDDLEDGDEMRGTPSFMAPEQVASEGIDARTDVFALGATLYACVAGRPPYPAGAIQALAQAYQGTWTPLDQVLEGPVPAGMGAIIERAMAKAPGDRYASLAALQRDLEGWLRGRWRLPTRTYGAGETVVREGDFGDEAFVILSGHCDASTVIRGKERVLAELGPGDVFGEIAIFSGRPRSSTVTAVGTLTVQVVTRETLTAATGLDSWVGTFITVLVDRFLAVEQQLHLFQEGRTSEDR